MPGRGGWRRLGKRRFRYVDSRGRPVEDEDALERIRSLAIPPAWTDVWISPTPGAKLQATGEDAAGRRQYLYHPSFRAAQEREKFERLLGLATRLPDLRARMARHLELGPYEREWACALALRLINHAWFRVGSERHARSARTYGITTLTKRHLTLAGDEIAFCFRAKNRKLVRRRLRNARLARELDSLLELPGGARLFRFQREDGVANLTAPVLNEYIAENLGEGYTAKDFRTWGGTLVGAVSLARHGPPSSEAEGKRAIASAMRKVASELGNTPAVARASYVSPVVLDAFLAGRTLDDYRPRSSRRRRQLGVDEQALLRLLRAEARPGR